MFLKHIEGSVNKDYSDSGFGKEGTISVREYILMQLCRLRHMKKLS